VKITGSIPVRATKFRLYNGVLKRGPIFFGVILILHRRGCDDSGLAVRNQVLQNGEFLFQLYDQNPDFTHCFFRLPDLNARRTFHEFVPIILDVLQGDRRNKPEIL
jgi:hypothetical protein